MVKKSRIFYGVPYKKILDFFLLLVYYEREVNEYDKGFSENNHHNNSGVLYDRLQERRETNKT